MSYADDGVVLALISLGIVSAVGFVRERPGSRAFDLGAALEVPEQEERELWIGRAIRRQGKLGGKGYTTKPWSERQPILDSCVEKYGYRSCLGSIQVLLNIGTAGRKATDALEHDKEYLVTTYGGEGSFGPREGGRGSRAAGWQDRKLVLYGRVRGRTEWEEIDTAGNADEKDYLLQEYRLAFGPNWQFQWQAEVQESQA
jgi:hypothetical protein